MENSAARENNLNTPDAVPADEEFMNAPENIEEHEEISADPSENKKEQSVPEQEATKFSFEDVRKKLEREQTEGGFSKAKGIMEKTIEYLEKRCSEDNGLINDIMQEHKTWKKCFSYCEAKAREAAEKGARGVVVEGGDLLEWIEDYYRKDDAAEEARKKAVEEEARKKREEQAKKRKEEAKKKETGKKKKTEKETAEPAKEPKKDKPEKAEKKQKTKEIDGQMSMFDLM